MSNKGINIYFKKKIGFHNVGFRKFKNIWSSFIDFHKLSITLKFFY
jgi:hypothetical protein